MEGEVVVEGPSLPSNYVSIQQLKERWLQHHHHQNPAKYKPHDDKADSQSIPKPNDEAAFKRVPHRRPDRRRVINQLKPKVAAENSDSGFKTQVDVADDHPKGDKEKDHSNSKLSNKKKGSRGRKPRFVTDQNPNGGGTPLLEPEAVMDKIQIQQLGVRRSRNQNVVWEPKDKMPPLAHNDARGHGVVEDVAIAAAVTVPSVSEGRSRRRGSERPQGKPRPKPSKPPFGVKKGQTSLVWVKKGESAAN